jgi:hypothetical protein
LDLFTESPWLTNGFYELSVPGFEPFEAYCDMETAGWTLVYLASVSPGYSDPSMTADQGDLGEEALGPDDEGHWKLDDEKINALRSGGMPNDLMVRGLVSGSVLGQSYHPNTCEIDWTSGTTDSDCMLSTLSGPWATDYTGSAHAGAITRWYVDASFGYIFPHLHIGPISGGHSHGSSLPNPYCTFYDHRACPEAAKFQVWIY